MLTGRGRERMSFDINLKGGEELGFLVHERSKVRLFEEYASPQSLVTTLLSVERRIILLVRERNYIGLIHYDA